MRLPSPALVIAVTQLPRNSVGTQQLKKSAVTSQKIKDGAIATADLSAAAREALRGQKGDTGATGATGAPGTALAFGYVFANTTPTIDATFSSGVTGVTRPSTGVFCIELDPALRSAAFTTTGPSAGEPRRPAVVTPEYAESPAARDIYVSNQSSALCGPYRYQVRVFLPASFSLSDGAAFNFVVP